MSPDIYVESISEFPESQDFLSFRVVKKSGHKEKEVCRIQAGSIVEMRRFMASLGARGSGLFSTQSNAFLDAGLTSDPPGQPAVLTTGASSVYALPATNNYFGSYSEVISHLPVDFYYNSSTGIRLPEEVVKTPSFPGSILPLYDASAPPPVTVRRQTHDTFKPPHGEPCHFLHSLGYGQEVGLPNGVQEIYNPCTGRSFFIDHNLHTVIEEDLRPHAILPDSTQPIVLDWGDRDTVDIGIPPHIDTPQSVIQEASNRARSKPTRYILQAQGRNGKRGRDGAQGYQGLCGEGGKHGVRNMLTYKKVAHGEEGKAGGKGGSGYDGEQGGNGRQGPDVNLILSGTVENLSITGTQTFTANLGDGGDDGVLLVDNRGGNGARGGNGGMGGVGGRGGQGGNGGLNASTFGRGGNGGNGGGGGEGGMGGNGGDGGKGGNCLIQTSDPKLLVLVEVDCLGGEPSPGGAGGEGGAGGRAGFGGPGQTDWSSGVAVHGQPGLDGPRGFDGFSGRNGKPGKYGGLLWVVFSPTDNRVLEESHLRYDATLLTSNVVPSLEGGVFEPNSKIVVSGLVVRNTGGLILPPGTKVSIPSSSTVKFEPSFYEIPQCGVKPNQDLLIPISFHGRICDFPPPNTPGIQSKTVEFHTRVELLGRPFEHSFLKHELAVQYPIQLGSLHCSKNMSRGEISSIAIEVSNISDRLYGCCSDSSGKVVLHLHLDARILPLGAYTSDGSSPCIVTYDPAIRDSMFIELSEIPPKQTTTVKIMVQMENQAELCENCYWQADLYLQGKLIEYNHQHIRVSPAYSPHSSPADILFVTSDAISQKEFLFWLHIFKLLDTTVDFWDVSQNRGFSVDSATGVRHVSSWQGRYTGKMILYPHCDIQLISRSDIIQHFHGDSSGEVALKELGSSMVLFLPQLTLAQQCDRSLLRHLTNGCDRMISLRQSNRHWHQLRMHPESEQRWGKKYLTTFEKDNPSQSVVVGVGRSTGDDHTSDHQVEIRRVPILRSSKFLGVSGAGGVITNMGLDDVNLSPHTTDIPLASNFGQVFLVTLYGLPVSKKLKLLRASASTSFHLPNQLVMSREELVMVSLAREVADEILNCSGEALRMREIHADIKANPSAYFDNGVVILQGLSLIKREAQKYLAELKTSNTKQAYGEIVRLLNEAHTILVEIGVDITELGKLPGLELLRDMDRISECHRYFVRDGGWNLL